MSTLAYTLLAASGGGGGSKYYVAFAGATSTPKPNNGFVNGTSLVTNADADIIIGGRGDHSTGYNSCMLYNIKNSDLSIDNLANTLWGTRASPNGQDSAQPMGGGWSIGTQEGDSGGRYTTALHGPTYNIRGTYWGKPSTWNSSTNKKGGDMNSSSNNRHTKDSKLSKEDNRDLYVLGDTYSSPSASAYNTLFIKFKQSTPDTGSVSSQQSSTKELGSSYSSTTCRGYSIDTDSSGNAYIGGQWKKPYSTAGYYFPYIARLNQSGLGLEYIKYIDDDYAYNVGVHNLCVHGSHIYVAYDGKGKSASSDGGTRRIVICKLNASNGSEVWTRSVRTNRTGAGGGTEKCIGIDTDSDGNVYYFIRTENDGNFGNQTDPTNAGSNVRNGIAKINADGSFGFCNVLGGDVGRGIDNWDEGKGNRLVCDELGGVNVALAKNNGTSMGSGTNKMAFLRVPQDGSGTSSSAITVGNTSRTFYYNTATSANSVITYSLTTENVTQYTFQAAQNNADNNNAGNCNPVDYTNPSGHTITSTDI